MRTNNLNQSNRERIVYIDVAKGILILLVVAGHILQFNFKGFSKDVVFNWIYSFHMPVFMMLSGFVSSNKIFDLSISTFFHQIKRKFNQLMIPFLIWGGLVMPIIYGYNLKDYSSNFINLLISPHTGAWFLLSLFFIHLYFMIAIYISKYIKLKRIYAESIGILTILIITALINKSNIFYYFDNSFYFPAKFYIMYALGYFLNKYFKPIIFKSATLILSFIIFNVLVNKYDFETSSSILQLLISIPASFIIINLSNSINNYQSTNDNSTTTINIIGKHLSILGNNSLIIYLVHIPLIYFTNNVLIDSNNISAILLFICCIVLAIFISNLCVFIGNILKYWKYINKLLFGR